MGPTCPRHPGSPPVGYCTNCKSPVCSKCVLYRDGAIYCSDQCHQNLQMAALAVKNKLENVRIGPHPIMTMIRYAVFLAVVVAALEWFNVTNFISNFP